MEILKWGGIDCMDLQIGETKAPLLKKMNNLKQSTVSMILFKN